MTDSISQRNTPASERMISLRVLLYGIIVQFAGVTATLIGFLGLKDMGLVGSYTTGWPIYAAYSIAFLSIARGGWWLTKTNLKTTDALWHVFIFFIIADTILLGLLVYITGGAKVSIFTPVFLLIPTVAASYCKQLKFWGIVILNVAVYGTLLIVGNREISLESTTVNLVRNWLVPFPVIEFRDFS